jgi:hypothetical protein
MFLVKTLAFIWPFLKEMFLGDKTLKEAIKTNKMRVVIAVGILLSIAFNFVALPRLVTLTYDYVNLKRKHDELLKGLPPIAVPAPPPQAPASAPAPPPVPPPPKDAFEDLDANGIPDAEDLRYKKAKEFFDKMNALDNRARNR